MQSPYGLWAGAKLKRQGLRLAGTAVGIAIAVAMLASLFGFTAASEKTMTARALSDVTVDWQVQLAAGANPQVAIDELTASPGTTNLVQVGFFDTPGFQATTGSTVQTTGAGKVLGLGPGYRETFPAQVRSLSGAGMVLIAQQTAANLHAEPVTVVTIQRPGLPSVDVTIDEVVDLPLADSLFQPIGAAPGTVAQAPPDNVLILPLDQWHTLFDPVAAISPDSMHIQIHATLPHDLPVAPTNAYSVVSGQERNYEQRMAGQAFVGDNLAARLDRARSDALYARVLFLFLGLPGAFLAAILTVVFAGASATQRRKDQALLRLRGATVGQIVGFAGVEAAIVGLAGSALGLLLAALVVRWSFGRWTFGNGVRGTLLWSGVAALVGMALAAVAILYPAWRDVHRSTINGARESVGRANRWWWERIGLDFILLAGAAIVFWQAGRGGYQVVLVPEGVPKVSVSYTAFIAPLLLWVGAALLAMRLTRMALMRHGYVTQSLIRPIAGRLSGLVGASLGRQWSRVATGLVVLLLAVAFASSTAIFNHTYRAQASVDAQLTNGADVAVTVGSSGDLTAYVDPLAQLQGVQSVAQMQHRFAYVGADLQDLYGIDPATLGQTAGLADAFFLGATANETMATLAATPDGLLVSPETVSDFQLQPGDTIKLRMQNASDHQYHVVPFRFVGTAREFPTAPSDSFLVANAAYIAQQTGSNTVETILMRTTESPATVADRASATLGSTSGATVRSIDDVRNTINSGLTSISLKGLTQLELAFALALAAAGGGLVLSLGLEERRRTLAIASALGAKPRQLASFVWSEAILILVGGLVGGAALGLAIAHVLTKLLSHVFDPPPQHILIPWAYCSLIVLVTTSVTMLAAAGMVRLGQQDVLQTIRRL